MGSAARITVAAILAVALSGCGAQSGPTRDVILLARGMTFVVDGHPDAPNPVISLRAGERVRMVLKNEAPGLLHDFVIPAWDVAIPQLRAGEMDDVTFTVPDTRGRVGYQCRPHSELMNGFVEVVP